MKNSLNTYIKNNWSVARRTAGVNDLDLPYPFVPPSFSDDGLYHTLFYWDTYFTNVGLIVDGHTDWARENVDDLLYALDTFGCVPNYTRKDGADFCSQPPLLCLMVKDIFAQTKDEEWLKKAVAGLEKEYCFWMTKRITPIGLNQYSSNATDERLLEHYAYVSKRVPLDQNLSDAEKIRIARNFVAEGESGEDYTPRYSHHNALDYVQIDLNSHLYGVEAFLEEYFKDKDEGKSAYYKTQKEKRLSLIEKYCFNEKTGAYCDYDFVLKKQNEIVCAACFLPYFYGFARKDGNLSRIYNILKTKGGVVACQETENKTCQWGYPNIWAPNQFFAYEALTRYGYFEEAEELRTNYMRLLFTVYEQTGTIWERYDENGAAADLEYPTQKMLGWTGATYQYFFSKNK